MEIINSKKKFNPANIHQHNKTEELQNVENNMIIIDGTKENTTGLQSKCCLIF